MYNCLCVFLREYLSIKTHCFDLCATYAFSFLVFLDFVPLPLFGKGIAQTGNALGPCHALFFPGKAGSAPSSRITVHLELTLGRACTGMLL